MLGPDQESSQQAVPPAPIRRRGTSKQVRMWVQVLQDFRHKGVNVVGPLQLDMLHSGSPTTCFGKSYPQEDFKAVLQKVARSKQLAPCSTEGLTRSAKSIESPSREFCSPPGRNNGSGKTRADWPSRHSGEGLSLNETFDLRTQFQIQKVFRCRVANVPAERPWHSS